MQLSTGCLVAVLILAFGAPASAQTMSLLGQRSEYAAGAGVQAEPVDSGDTRAVSIVVNAGSGDTARRITPVRWGGADGIQVTVDGTCLPAGSKLEVYSASAAKVRTLEAAELVNGVVLPGAGQYLDGDTLFLRLIGPSGALRVSSMKAQRSNIGFSDLAAHYAPFIYQDTDSDGKKYDLIAAIDFDGDFNGDNNWDHAGKAKDYPLGGDHHNQAALYWWASETATHWFVGYTVFHPRDWEDGLRAIGPLDFGEHENDMEGIQLWVRKDGSRFGKVELMQTVSHTDLWQYGDAAQWQNRKLDGSAAGRETEGVRESLDGPITFQGDAPCIYIEAKGHGIRGVAHEGGEHGVNYGPKADGKLDGDGVQYVPGEYALKPVRTLWTMLKSGQHDGEGKLFHDDVHMQGKSHGSENSASFPWSWQDSNYRAAGWTGGSMFMDPARVATWQFAPTLPVSAELTGKSWE